MKLKKIKIYLMMCMIISQANQDLIQNQKENLIIKIKVLKQNQSLVIVLVMERFYLVKINLI